MRGNTSHSFFLLAELQIHSQCNVPTSWSPFIWTNLENPFLQVPKLPCSWRSSCDTFGEKNDLMASLPCGTRASFAFLIKSGAIQQALPLPFLSTLDVDVKSRTTAATLWAWGDWHEGRTKKFSPVFWVTRTNIKNYVQSLYIYLFKTL